MTAKQDKQIKEILASPLGVTPAFMAWFQTALDQNLLSDAGLQTIWERRNPKPLTSRPRAAKVKP